MHTQIRSICVILACLYAQTLKYSVSNSGGTSKTETCYNVKDVIYHFSNFSVFTNGCVFQKAE